jgi:hypothetical protein
MVCPITVRECYVRETGKSMNAEMLDAPKEDGWRKIPISLKMPTRRSKRVMACSRQLTMADATGSALPCVRHFLRKERTRIRLDFYRDVLGWSHPPSFLEPSDQTRRWARLGRIETRKLCPTSTENDVPHFILSRLYFTAVRPRLNCSKLSGFHYLPNLLKGSLR